MSIDAFAALGEYLTASEAAAIASLLDSGERLTGALGSVNPSRREKAKELLVSAGLGHQQRALSISVLRTISGAKSVHRQLVPVWTMPGNEASTGHLTGEFHRLVSAARQSITCASYNFATTSQMWNVLRTASNQPGVVVTLYLDAKVSDAVAVKAQLPRATVYRSGVLPTGAQIVSHAKFIVIDHELLLLTSANFSFSAENRNIEFGLLVRESGLAESVEATMTSKHGSLYELV